MTRVLTLISVWVLAFFLMPWGTGGAKAGGSAGIIVRPSASVDTGEIFLGELARIEADGLVRQMLEEIYLGRSPKPGKVKTMTRRQILASLRSQQDLVDSLGIEIPDRVFIKRNSQELSEEALRSYLEDYLKDQFNGREVAIERLAIPKSGQYPLGEVTMAAAAPPRINRGGRFTLGLEIFVNGHKEHRMRISGQVAVYGDILIAAKKLFRGSSLSSGDARMVRQNIFTLNKDAADSPEGLNGKTLTRDVEEGEAILMEWLRPIPLVHKGDVVTLVAQKDSILIQTFGVSREDGAMGSLVEVENIRSGKVVRGLVRKPSTVEVIY